ncbi:MAG: ATPase domain-containing protein [Pseudomonadota bacterium]|nr:ATPase domain-containing protein [Pseudomonadota bacterium]
MQSGKSGPGRSSPRVPLGIEGLDDVLGGGITPDRLYLLEGSPGTGKTTLALQFLLHGAARGEACLYITLSETADELRAVADTHGWSLDDLTIFEMVSEEEMEAEAEQSILHPAEVELGETTNRIIAEVQRLQPKRVVFDSLSELRLLAQHPLRYRRQILGLKQFFSRCACTVLMLDDRTSDPADLQLHSIAHGVITLEQSPRDFGAERRRLRIVKMRGIKFRGGYHDFELNTGGLIVYPRLVAADHRSTGTPAVVSTGLAELDALLGGGLMPASNTLLMGPSGVGKTTTAVSCMLAALHRGEACTYFLFDEGLTTLRMRSAALGMDLQPHLDCGRLTLLPIDPAELSPGEFVHRVRTAVEVEGTSFIVIDSLNAYLQAMPGERFLLLQMHELLNYLNQKSVTTLLILGQHGLVGEMRSDLDLSYLSDTILLFRFFECRGELLTAASVVKSRTTAHERTIREFKLGPSGLRVGPALSDFQGVMSGLPTYRGAEPLLESEDR